MDSISDYEYVALHYRQKVNGEIESCSCMNFPVAISCHASVIYKNKLYVVGGLNWQVEDVIFYYFNFDTLKWKELDWEVTEEKSKPVLKRIGHTVNIISLSEAHFRNIFDYKKDSVDWDCMVMFGGVLSNFYDNGLWLYSFSLNLWRNVKFSERSVVPSPRAGHSAVVWRNFLIVHGGYKLFNIYSDTFVFDFNRLLWTQIVPDKGLDVVYSRSWHLAAVWKDYMYVHSGCDGNDKYDPMMRLDLKSMTWEIQPEYGIIPAPRSRHVGVVVNDRWLIQGGRSYKKKIYNDFFEFNFDSSVWLPVYIKDGFLFANQVHVNYTADYMSLKRYTRCCHSLSIMSKTQTLLMLGGAQTLLQDSDCVYMFKYYPRYLNVCLNNLLTMDNTKLSFCSKSMREFFEYLKDTERGILLKVFEYI